MDPDPESKVGSALPVWYTTLKRKYERYLHDHQLIQPAHSKFTLGKFAVFLANCVEGSITITAEESDAFSEVNAFETFFF